MSWLRIDDGFPEHPKIVALGKPADRWTWLELLAYCARRTTEGKIPAGIDDVLRRVTPAFLNRCQKVGLVDRSDDGKLVVHDWNIYNAATIQERVFAYLEANPDATANEVQRVTRANRQAVLGLYAEFHRFRSGSGSGSGLVPESSERFQQVVPAPAPAPAFDLQAFVQKAEPLLLPSREGLPTSHTPEERDPLDYAGQLLDALPDADQGTETVIRSFRLPEHAYRNALEEVRRKSGGTKLAVTILKRIADEQVNPPNPAEPTRTNVQPADPETAIRTMITNGALHDPVELEAELRAHNLNGDTADQLRALLLASPDDDIPL